MISKEAKEILESSRTITEMAAAESLPLPYELSGFEDTGNNYYSKEIDRYSRHDHGGGRNGDGWMDPEDIKDEYKMGEKKHKAKLDRVNAVLSKNGFKPTAKFDLGEKGHFSLEFKLERDPNFKPKKVPPTPYLLYYSGNEDAELMDSNRRVVFKIAMDDNGEIDLVKNGEITSIEDFKGLTKYLIKKKVIPAGARIFPEPEEDEFNAAVKKYMDAKNESKTPVSEMSAHDSAHHDLMGWKSKILNQQRWIHDIEQRVQDAKDAKHKKDLSDRLNQEKGELDVMKKKMADAEAEARKRGAMH